MRPRKKTRKKNQKTIREEAGEAIAAGGYGCVFRPAINCKGKIECLDISKKPYITKLMLTRNANDEMNEVKKLLPIIEKLPSKNRHFLLDGIFQPSSFGPLAKEDMKNFDNKCSNLMRKGIFANNVNDPKVMKNLSAIYIPDGGKTLGEFIRDIAYNKMKTPNSTENIGLMNWGLMNVIKNAIVPMNEAGLVHFDIKPDNMLIGIFDNKHSPNIKIIDWGLAVTHTQKTDIPIMASSRPFQFNLPPSVILLQQHIEKYIITLSKDFKTIDIPDIAYKTISASILGKAVDSGFEGHMSHMINSMAKLSNPFKIYNNISNIGLSNSCFKASTMSADYSINYVAEIIKKFSKIRGQTKNNVYLEFNKEKYYNEVFKYNCDIWGALTTYSDFILNWKVGGNPEKMWNKSKVCMEMRKVLFKYCFSPRYASERIPINELLKDMKEISIICGITEKPQDMPMKTNMEITSKNTPNTYSSNESTKEMIVGPTTKNVFMKDKSTPKKSTSKKSNKSIIERSMTRRCPRGYKRIKNTRNCIRNK